MYMIAQINIDWKHPSLRYAAGTTLLVNGKEEMAELLRRVERFSEEAGLTLNISMCCIMIINKRYVIHRPLQYIRVI